MPIELCDDDGSDRDGALEGLGLVVRRLTNGPVYHEYDAVGLNGVLDFSHLLKQRVLLLVATRGIHDNQVVLFLPEALDASRSNSSRVGLRVTSVERDAGLCTVLLELVEGTRTERIRANHSRPVSPPLVGVSILRARRRLTVSLETNEHNDVALPLLELVGLGAWVKHRAKLTEDGLFDYFPLVETRGHVLQLDGFLHVISQLLHELDVNITLNQRCCDILQAIFENSVVNEGHVGHVPQRPGYFITKLR
mmetsp:Transcript_14949/g.28940  ORF Transcript_14949/g.28940 Transcript_14949/m.28940 type:complete len:251 (-) Transcript_14949:88-840(-)